MNGYYSSPALSAEHIAFVCEDALWIMARDEAAPGGGLPRRLTAGTEIVRGPCFSPDGSHIAFETNFEGISQVFVVPAVGGVPRRVTYDAGPCFVVGFRRDGRLLFRSNAHAAQRYQPFVYEMELSGAGRSRVPVGRAATVSFAEDEDRVVIGLNQLDNARWKRYRGGTAGDIWIGSVAKQEFRRLIETGGGPVRPVFCGDRIYFLDDTDGFSNLWSCDSEGGDLRQHTHHRDYYVRNLSGHGSDLAYQKGGDIFVYDTQSEVEQRVDVRLQPGGEHLRRKFISAEDHLHDMSLSPEGKDLALTVRGKALAMRAWGGPVRRYGERSGVRYRYSCFLHDNRRIATVSDEGGEEAVEIYDAATRQRLHRKVPSTRRITSLVPSPVADIVVATDVSGLLFELDFEDAAGDAAETTLARGGHGQIRDVAWSRDGRWVAYVIPEEWTVAGGLLEIHDRESRTTQRLNESELPVHSPTFDTDGRFLYVLSERTFNPAIDSVHFAASVHGATRLYAFVLGKDEISPFDPRWPDRLEVLEKEKEKRKEALKEEREKAQAEGSDEEVDSEEKAEEKDEEKDLPEPVTIDFEGIRERLVEFPGFEPGFYSSLQAAPGKVLVLEWPRTGLLDHDGWGDEPDDGHLAKLLSFDMKTGKQVTMAESVRGAQVCGERVLVQTPDGIRLLKAGEEEAEDAPEGFSPQSGWIDLGRARIEIVPGDEWRQMFEEAWRLQRERFWTEDMSGIDWHEVRERYLPLLDRVTTRDELSDLVWELQGELGTSHAYEVGGDYPQGRSYPIGSLGADLSWDGVGYRVDRVLLGDPWRPDCRSSLAAPGVDVCEGDRIMAVDGREVSEESPPEALLVQHANTDVELLVGRDGEEPRTVVVHTLRGEAPLRYRDWVRRNRETTRERSHGQLGYLHIPDMGGEGLSEFLRAFRAESKHPGLVVDLRGNGGGFVSALIVDYLRRKVIGYEKPRYGHGETYPSDAVRGPIVGIIDQFAGSDGDVISHAFKAYEIGPLIGKRTWGGVIGINVDDALADGTIVTQPEYASYFHGVGWGIENRGIEPDIEVELDPASSAAGKDPQLARAIEVALERLEADPVRDPEWPPAPSLRVT